MFRAIGDKLPTDPNENLGDALFDAILAADRALISAVGEWDEWDEDLEKVGTDNKRIQFAVPELFEELDSLATEDRMPANAAYAGKPWHKATAAQVEAV